VTSMVSWLLGVPKATGLDPLDDRYYQPAGGSLSRSGVRVSADSAMKASTVYRCVSILANILAMFPKGMYEYLERGRRPAPEHPLDPIISFRPNRQQNAFVFWRQVCHDLVLRQNAYVQIVPGSPGRGWVGGLIPLHPDRVRGPEELPDGSLRYEYTRPGNLGTIRMTGGIDIWHLHGLSSDGLRGLSMLDVASDSIGLALAAERHASRFFERGVKPTGILQHDKTLKPETAREMGESFGRVYGGEAGTGRVPVLWEGMKFTPVSMTLKDAEFLDSRKFSVADISRWFGVPPHMVGDVERSTSWGTGIEQQGLHFLVYSLLPWIELIEQSIRFTLVVQPERYYPKMNVNAILRMDAKAQADVFAIMIDKGVLNPNECRELLERNPRAGGDEYVNPAGPKTVAAPVPPPDPEDDVEEEDPEDDPEEDGAQAIAQADAVARALATARAEELLAEEKRRLAKMAVTHAADPAAWEVAVRRFYGHFAGRLAEGLACGRAAARGWCDARKALVVAESLAALEADAGQAVDALVALAMSNGGKTTC
jgi:HK97 family phage portal protein